MPKTGNARHMVRKNKNPLCVVFFAVQMNRFQQREVVKCESCFCCESLLWEADVSVGGRCHMLSAKDLLSHATLSRNDVKIAQFL